MLYVVAALSVVVFVVALRILRLVPIAQHTLETSRDALVAIRNPDLTEDEKERRARKSAMALLGQSLSIAFRGIAALALSAVPAALAHALGLAAFSEVTSLLVTWQALAALTVLVAVAYVLGARV